MNNKMTEKVKNTEKTVTLKSETLFKFNFQLTICHIKNN